jgi:prepilin-type N-terminal cleavage/methylation domain-containing protein
MYRRATQQGFSLVELMVVCAIIVIMVGIILGAVSVARENTREKKRISDLANIELAIALARQRDGDYPAYPSGAEVGATTALDNTIRALNRTGQANGTNYADPSSQDGVYEYWYDSSFTCTQPGQVVLFAKTMEQSKNANFSTLCTHASAGGEGATSNSYVKIIDPGL